MREELDPMFCRGADFSRGGANCPLMLGDFRGSKTTFVPSMGRRGSKLGGSSTRRTVGVEDIIPSDKSR